MKEEKLIHHSYSAYFNDENNNNNNNLYSLFHNCFHSYEIIDWLMKKQLCKTVHDGQEIFQVLEKLKIIHHGKIIFFYLALCQNKNLRRAKELRHSMVIVTY
jgi:hypothetical protein